MVMLFLQVMYYSILVNILHVLGSLKLVAASLIYVQWFYSNILLFQEVSNVSIICITLPVQLFTSCTCTYSGPWNLRPLCLRIPFILRPVLSDTIYSCNFQYKNPVSFRFKTTFKLKTIFSGRMGSLKMQEPLYF